ncbi:cytochrome P450 [Penicillium antarcticum]|uniref:cytochrome P450 n=1 Tax=Penicillium antarcticum TaxID=416450 RepID=UPI00238E4A83|nr:cytochrome P450 [Penicillium antarcticum]KAJ5288398.1 cytochrome P450 [Penicillium antarcticum]
MALEATNHPQHDHEQGDLHLLQPTMNLAKIHAWDLVGAVLAALVLRAFYRLYLHPLARIPGPKMTAITSLYELYYNVVCDGRFIFRIEEMHKKYVHIIDPDFYDEIYTSSVRKRDKEPTFVPTFGVPYAAVATVKHDVHRYRRSLLYEFFSRRSVSRLSPVIEERVGKLMSRLVEFHVGGEVVDLCGAFGALTSDVITFCCYGKSWGFLEDPDFRSDIRTAANDFAGV